MRSWRRSAPITQVMIVRALWIEVEPRRPTIPNAKTATPTTRLISAPGLLVSVIAPPDGGPISFGGRRAGSVR